MSLHQAAKIALEALKNADTQTQSEKTNLLIDGQINNAINTLTAALMEPDWEQAYFDFIKRNSETREDLRLLERLIGIDVEAVKLTYNSFQKYLEEISRLRNTAKQALDILLEWDSLIKYQYYSSQEGMSALTGVAHKTVAVIESLNAVLPADVTKKEGTL